MKTHLFNLILCIGLVISSCTGAITPEPMEIDAVILVVDDFSLSPYKEVYDTDTNCVVTSEGQKFGSTGTGLIENPVDAHGNPVAHGNFVYDDLIAQHQQQKEELSLKTGANPSWMKRVSTLDTGQKKLMVVGVDTEEYTTKAISENISDALSLFQKGADIELDSGMSQRLTQVSQFVINMSFAIVPCKVLTMSQAEYEAILNDPNDPNSEALRNLKAQLEALIPEPDYVKHIVLLKHFYEQFGADNPKFDDDPLYKSFSSPAIGNTVLVGAAGNKGQYFSYPFAPAIWHFVISVSAEGDNTFTTDPPCFREGIDDYSNCGEIKMNGNTNGDKGTSYAAPKFSYRIALYLINNEISKCTQKHDILSVFGYAGDGGPWKNLAFEDAENTNCIPYVTATP